MRAVLLRSFGGAEQLFLGSTPRPLLQSQGEVLLRVVASGVNRADLLQRQGKYPPPKGCSDILGLEAAGEVVESRSTRWRPGDRVMALLPGGGYGEFCSAHEATLMPIPEDMDYVTAACIPETYITAFQLLRLVAAAPLKRETDVRARNVLVHAAASGVGTAAIQLASQVFHTSHIVATASSEEKLALCRQLGATHALSYKVADPPLEKQVLEATGGRGIDVVLDPVAGPLHFPASLKACAQDASYVLYAAMGGSKLKDFSLAPFLLKRIRLLPSTLRSRDVEYKRRLVNDFSEEVLPALASGALRPVLDQCFAVEDVSSAHLRMEANLNSGKIVLQWPDAD